MAKIVGLIGGLNGKMGSAVFSTRRGVAIGRAYQPVVHNPNTLRQQLSRAKFALASKTVRGMHEFVAAAWQRYRPSYEIQQAAGKMVPVSSNIILGTSPEGIRVQFTNLANAFPAGDIPLPTFTALREVADLTLGTDVTLDAGCYREIDGTPCKCGVVLCVYDPMTNSSVVNFAEVNEPGVRQTVQINVPLLFSGATCESYMFAKQIPIAVNGIDSGTPLWKFPARVSRTVYMGRVEPA